MDNRLVYRRMMEFQAGLRQGWHPVVGWNDEERAAAAELIGRGEAEWNNDTMQNLRRAEKKTKEVSRDTKPTNPKDEIASASKVPLHLWPQSATIHGALALLAGRQKYGRSNWREAGVRATIYKDALDRHMGLWFEGEDNDDETGLSHLGHALACIAILVDARESGKFVDDRQFPGPGQAKLLAWAGEETKRLIALYADRPAPKHFSRLTEGESGAPETEQL
jgi:hypothetical protein